MHACWNTDCTVTVSDDGTTVCVSGSYLDGAGNQYCICGFFLARGDSKIEEN